MSASTPDVRFLANGDAVVDWGLTWFRVRSNGEIIRKTAAPSGVTTKPATQSEIRKVRACLEAAKKVQP